jgi:hypothetical protein
MTLLSNRPVAASRTEEPGGRSLTSAAALAGAGAAAVGLVVCMSVALTGWFLADAGGHGDTTDALRVGADAWLAGHGSHLVLSGVPLGITPLGVTMIVVLTAVRGGRWAARHARTGTQVADDGALALAVATFTGAYVVLAVVTCVLASQSGATPVLGRAVLGSLLVAALAGGSGLAAGTGRLAGWVDAAPGWAHDVVVGGLAGLLWLLAAGAALVGLALLLSFNEAATVLSELHLSAGDALSYTVVTALFAPNAALFGTSYLLGPGFAFGTGTTVSPSAVSLGVVPAYPVLAALPDDGPTPGWLVVLLGVPVVAAALGAAMTLRRSDPVPLDLAALRGAGAGLLGGVLATVLVATAGGPLGTGRMADIGAPVGEVLVFATGLMCVGGALGALAQAWWGRRHGAVVTPGLDEEYTEALDLTQPVDLTGGSRPADADSHAHPGSDEPTIEVHR